MPKRSNLVIILADGEHARLVRRDADGVLRTAQKFDSTAAHKRSADLGTDAPGASFHSDSTAHHALTPRHDLHEQEKANFARYIAQQLNGMAEHGAFDALLIVALPDTAAVIESALSVAVENGPARHGQQGSAEAGGRPASRPSRRLDPIAPTSFHPLGRTNNMISLLTISFASALLWGVLSQPRAVALRCLRVEQTGRRGRG